MVRADDEDGNDSAGSPSGQQRLDKWLWFARIVKSRTLGATLVSGGKIRVNKAKAEKPSQLVKPGDVITSTAQRDVRVFQVVAPGTRRGPAAEAQALYVELTERGPPAAEGRQGRRQPRMAQQAAREPGSGRPTKLERRQIDKLTGRS